MDSGSPPPRATKRPPPLNGGLDRVFSGVAAIELLGRFHAGDALHLRALSARVCAAVERDYLDGVALPLVSRALRNAASAALAPGAEGERRLLFDPQHVRFALPTWQVGPGTVACLLEVDRVVGAFADAVGATEDPSRRSSNAAWAFMRQTIVTGKGEGSSGPQHPTCIAWPVYLPHTGALLRQSLLAVDDDGDADFRVVDLTYDVSVRGPSTFIDALAVIGGDSTEAVLARRYIRLQEDVRVGDAAIRFRVPPWILLADAAHMTGLDGRAVAPDQGRAFARDTLFLAIRGGGAPHDTADEVSLPVTAARSGPGARLAVVIASTGNTAAAGPHWRLRIARRKDDASGSSGAGDSASFGNDPATATVAQKMRDDAPTVYDRLIARLRDHVTALESCEEELSVGGGVKTWHVDAGVEDEAGTVAHGMLCAVLAGAGTLRWHLDAGAGSFPPRHVAALTVPSAVAVGPGRSLRMVPFSHLVGFRNTTLRHCTVLGGHTGQNAGDSRPIGLSFSGPDDPNRMPPRLEHFDASAAGCALQLGACVFAGHLHVRCIDLSGCDHAAMIGDGFGIACAALEDVSFPPNIQSVGHDALCNCPNLRVVRFAPTTRLTALGRAFCTGCAALQRVEWPEWQEGNVDSPPPPPLLSLGAMFLAGSRLARTWIVRSPPASSATTIESEEANAADEVSRLLSAMTISEPSAPSAGAEPDANAAARAQDDGTGAACPIAGLRPRELSVRFAHGALGLEMCDLRAAAWITDVGLQAFERCRDLRRLWFPATVRTIGAFVCHECPRLEVMDLSYLIELQLCAGTAAGTVPQNILRGCRRLHTLRLPAQTDEVPPYFAADCDELRTVTIEGVSDAERVYDVVGWALQRTPFVNAHKTK